MAAKKIAPPTPRDRFVRHLARPTWGIGHVIDVYAGLVRVLFADGVVREFRADVLAAVPEADVPPDVLAAAATRAQPAAEGPVRKAAPRKKRVAKEPAAK